MAARPIRSATRDHLKTIGQRLPWLSRWTVHEASHLRLRDKGIKTGGLDGVDPGGIHRISSWRYRAFAGAMPEKAA